MGEKTIKDFINGPVQYDKYGGQYFWIVDKNDGMKMLASMRGWGAIQNLFKYGTNGQVNMEAAADFQDELGEFIAEAINEKIERLNQNKS
jgi:hypothetical protein